MWFQLGCDMRFSHTDAYVCSVTFILERYNFLSVTNETQVPPDSQSRCLKEAKNLINPSNIHHPVTMLTWSVISGYKQTQWNSSNCDYNQLHII